jgi:small subunit ribosomal protein S9
MVIKNEKEEKTTKKIVLKKVAKDAVVKKSDGEAKKTKVNASQKSTATKKTPLRLKESTVKALVVTDKKIKELSDVKVERIVDDENPGKKMEIKNVSEKQVKIVKKTADKKVLDNSSRAYATGKRKNAIAKVWLKKGKGNITINGKTAEEYLKRAILDVIVNIPFNVTNTSDNYDVVCQVCGGGLSGQAGAIRQGISKALLIFNAEAYRKELKQAGLLTRDSRVVERKKPGLKKARKGQVFSKR